MQEKKEGQIHKGLAFPPENLCKEHQIQCVLQSKVRYIRNPVSGDSSVTIYSTGNPSANCSFDSSNAPFHHFLRRRIITQQREEVAKVVEITALKAQQKSLLFL